MRLLTRGRGGLVALDRCPRTCTITCREPESHSATGEVPVLMRTLPDYLRKNMKMVLVGSNPGDRSARVGHYYAGRGNQFWPIMYESGVIPEPIGYEDDRRIVEFGIGMTDLVKRPTKAMEEIERQEFAEGRVLLAQKLEQLRPRVIAFNGKMVYEKFSGRECKLGLQKELLYGAQVFVLPSTSGQNGGSEKAVKMRYFKKLALLLKHLKD
jgi:mismatch-specific thymine-DNA glycosylase